MIRKILLTLLRILEPSEKELLVERIRAYDDKKIAQINTILDHVEDLNWKTVIMGSEDFKNIVESGPMANLGNFNLSDKLDALPSTTTTVGEITDPQLRQMLLDAGAELDDLVDISDIDDFYGIDNSPFNDLYYPGYSQRARMGDIEFGMQKHGLAKDIDGVYNFAVVYLYGNKEKNIITVFTVDTEKRLFTHEQINFKLKTYTDVIEACENIHKKYSLDHIFLVHTDASEKIKPFIERGLEDNIKVTLQKELISFENRVESMVPLMSQGRIFVNNDPWLFELQRDISAFFSQRYAVPTRGGNLNNTYPRLKSFAYGVEIWENNIETNLFVRDYGIEETND